MNLLSLLPEEFTAPLPPDSLLRHLRGYTAPLVQASLGVLPTTELRHAPHHEFAGQVSLDAFYLSQLPDASPGQRGYHWAIGSEPARLEGQITPLAGGSHLQLRYDPGHRSPWLLLSGLAVIGAVEALAWLWQSELPGGAQQLAWGLALALVFRPLVARFALWQLRRRLVALLSLTQVSR